MRADTIRVPAGRGARKTLPQHPSPEHALVIHSSIADGSRGATDEAGCRSDIGPASGFPPRDARLVPESLLHTRVEREPAVQDQSLSGDPGGFGRGEEGRRAADVLR